MEDSRHRLAAAGIVVALGALLAPSAHADRTFSIRYAASEHGQVTLVSNSLETCVPAFPGCTAARNGTGTPADNSQFPMGYVDVDSDATTFDSTAANLSLPSGATVLWAGLYWAADTAAGTFGAAAPSPSSRAQVRFAPPGAGYSTVTAAMLDTDATSATSYQGMADVTAQVSAAGSGAYWVANVQAGTGMNRWAGWGIVVAYRDAGQPLRRLHVYDGLRPVQSAAPTANIALGDFLTPASGTVRGRLALLSWEGDRALTGDGATLGARALSDAVNPANDFFNSTIARDGMAVSTRNPAYVNTTSVDADELSIDGALGNGVTSSTLHLATGAERYLVGAVALATDEGPPINRTAPTVTGTPRDGSPLAADRGAWDGTPTVGYAYQWRRCNPAGNGCADIAAATGSTYTPSADDVGSTLRVAVAASNAAGATTATSAPTAAVAASAPVNTAAPTLSGTTRWRHAHRRPRHVDRHPVDRVRVPVAALRRGRRRLRRHRRCHGRDLHARVRRRRRDDPRDGHRDERGRLHLGGEHADLASRRGGARQHRRADDLGHLTRRRHADRVVRLLERHAAADLRLPVAAMRRPRYGLRRCRRRHVRHLRRHERRPRPHAARARDRRQRRGQRERELARHGRRDRGRAREQRAAGDHGNGARRPDADREPGHLDRHAADRICVPVAALQRRRHGVYRHLGSDREHLHARASRRRIDGAGARHRQRRRRFDECRQHGERHRRRRPAGQHDAADRLRHGPRGRDHHWAARRLERHAAAELRLPMAALRSRRSELRGHPRRHRPVVHPHRRRRPRSRARAGHGDERRRLCERLVRSGLGQPRGTVEHGAARHLRNGARRPDAYRERRDLGRHAAVHVYPRVAALRCLRRELHGDRRRDRHRVPADVGRCGIDRPRRRHRDQRRRLGAEHLVADERCRRQPADRQLVAVHLRHPARRTHPHHRPRGTWSGSTPLSYAYQWRRCDADGSGCADITGATQATYTLADADVHHTVRVAVTASNSAGSAAASSPATDRIDATGPALTSAPTVSGTARDGSTLTADHGTWSGTPPISYAYRWQRCDTDGTGCTDITAATDSTYVLSADDVDHVLRVRVTATNAGGSATTRSAPTSRVAPRGPESTSPPSVTGTARDGSTLTADRGTWSGTPPLTYAYQWQRCDASGEVCADIAAATDSTYDLSSADVGSTVRVVVTATYAADSASASSVATAVVAPDAPANTTPPRVTGLTRDGELLSATRGVWSGTAPFTYAYQWQRCDEDGGACTDVTGATATTYRLTADDVDHAIRVVVTATNAAGAAGEPSAPTGRVSAAPPQSTAAPTVSGTARDGSTLTADHGSWTGTPPLTYAYRWQRCHPDADGCADIAGATDTTYDLTAADVGNTVRVAVTATNAGGAATAASKATGIVAALAPANTSAPTISGTPRDGRTLTADRGAWTGTPPIAYAYHWHRCDADGDACQDIADATGSTYELAPGDVGATLRVAVTASNTGGSTTATSDATGVVGAEGPESTAPPTISGEPRDGKTLTADPGTWSGTPPITYAFRWLRCEADGDGCTQIDGATDPTYTVTSSDAGSAIRAVVTATNGGGSASERSGPTAAVAANAPASTTPPTASGSPRDGELLAADPGSWSGTTPIDLAYRWQRCESGGAGCVDIDGADAQRYRLTSDDVGHAVRVVVTATNSAGPAEAESSPTAAIEGLAPANAQAPAVSGDAERGATLTAFPGAWSGTKPVDFEYRWERCDQALATCDVIAGATGATYALTDDDVDHRVRVVVTATNVAGRDDATSPPTARVAGAPRNVAAPSVSGDARDSSTLTADPGDWRGSQPIAYAYRWQRCDAQGADCETLPGASEATYEPAADDVGHAIVIEVTATNRDGDAAASSRATVPVAAVGPTNAGLPAISGTARDGRTLTADHGAWTGTPTISYAYRWQRCDGAGSACDDIDGATAATYTLTSPDAGHAIRVRVAATNDAGSAIATSAATAAVAANPPVGEGPPAVDGTARLGQTLTADRGAWDGTTPMGYAYRWQRCDASLSTCADIPAATGSTYTLIDDDVDRRVRVVVTATNTAGTDSATSPATAQITAAPAVLTAPSISGVAREHETLTANPGTWSGSQPIDFTYRWQRCDASGGGCIAIDGAAEQTYAVAGDDVGHALRVELTATNSAGSTSRPSGPTTPVAAVVPSPAPTPTPGPDPTPAPAPAPEAPVAAESGAPTAADLSSLPGSLVAARACQTLSGGSRMRSVAVRRVGRVVVRVTVSSAIVADAPLRISIAGPRGRPFAASATLDKTRLRLTASNPRTAALKPSQLGDPGTRTLRVRVTPLRGSARTAALRLRLSACRTAFTARQSRTARGTSLRLRVDGRAALSRVAFNVPSALTLRGGRRETPAGRLRITTLGTAPRTMTLTLPAGKRSGMLATSGGVNVGFSARGFTVRGLPRNTGIVVLTLAEPASAARGGVLRLRAAVSSTDGRSTLAVRVRGVRAR